MKLYKWFVWCDELQSYLPIRGLFFLPRSAFSDPVGVFQLKMSGLLNSFSIPMFH